MANLALWILKIESVTENMHYTGIARLKIVCHNVC